MTHTEESMIHKNIFKHSQMTFKTFFHRIFGNLNFFCEHLEMEI